MAGALMGRGARADVYSIDGRACKVFHAGAGISSVFREAYIGALAAEAGLPVPAVYGVADVEGCPAIQMESVPGKTLHGLLEQEPAWWEEAVGILARLQAEIHQAPVSLPFALADWLRGRIEGGNVLEESQKSRLFALLAGLPQGNALCHGDFHGGNVLTDGARHTVIDWANATAGHPDADACRTYMIYLLHMPLLAEGYLKAYCAQTGRRGEEILHWLPVLAGARLSEGFEEEQGTLMGLIKESLKP